MIHVDMNLENGVLLQQIPRGCSMDRVKGMMSTIGCAEVISVSASYSRCYSLT